MMQFNLQDVLIIKKLSTNQWSLDQSDNRYLEIICIEKGSGLKRTDGSSIHYRPQDVFLASSEDTVRFDINRETTFYIILFTELLFSNKINIPDRSTWLRRADFILQQPDLNSGDVIKNQEDRELLWQILMLILKENTHQEEYYKHIISNMTSTILSIIARNIKSQNKKNNLPRTQKSELIDELISYIHKYVYEPSRMKISALAETFNMTNSTLSNYFKKQTGKSLHHYILLYKLDLVKDRLENTDFTVSQIANQMGFTDESHLTRIFKKYFNTTPKGYKEAATESKEMN